MSVPTRSAPPLERLNAGMDGLRRALDEAPAAAEAAGAAAGVAALERNWTRRQRTQLLLTSLMMLLIVTGGLVLGNILFQREANTQLTLDGFKAQLDAANAKLTSQGLPPVLGPVNPQPGTAGQADLITAAGTASTLASLPQQVLLHPSAAELANAVAAFKADHPEAFQPSPDQLISGIANYLTGYLATHPPATGAPGVPGTPGVAGKDGVPGTPGRPPTETEIRVAFRDEVAANPNLLCSSGGVYGVRSLALSNGGSVDSFGCYGAAQGPPPTPEPTPSPTTTVDPSPTPTVAAPPT